MSIKLTDEDITTSVTEGITLGALADPDGTDGDADGEDSGGDGGAGGGDGDTVSDGAGSGDAD